MNAVHPALFRDNDTEALDRLVEAARLMAARGWLPATSGNLSCRLGPDRIAITASGIDKARLERRHLMIVPLNGPYPPGSSAETGLHLEAYRRDAGIGAVLHGHTVGSTVISRQFAARGEIGLEFYELQKAFAGVTTHETRLRVPIFANDQDIGRLAALVAARMPEYAPVPGYLIAGHGLYAWGGSFEAAFRHVEAFEFLFACELAAIGRAIATQQIL